MKERLQKKLLEKKSPEQMPETTPEETADVQAAMNSTAPPEQPKPEPEGSVEASPEIHVSVPDGLARVAITEIRIDRTKSLGDYQNIKLGFTATVPEGENPIAAVETLKFVLDWEISRSERETRHRMYTHRLAEIVKASDEPSEAVLNEAEHMRSWIADYEAKKAAMKTLTF